MKNYLLLWVAAALLLLSASVVAHSDAKPQHGGLLQSKYDLNFELVRAADGVRLYVDDHGEPVATEPLSGKIMLLAKSGKTEAPLTSAGPGQWFAPGLNIADGAKVVVTLTNINNDVMTVRFSF
ncbi:hypothetical protein [Rheinheimera nanhaiensis]|uniref:Uncharacterized protein n=1 Tax=Rheinheimera nanhaiensis E407-8 TaxID=562729 RepID=I1DZ72_9GAMM|nr:hypothetical protein [Rheinheimera nanhaiensis]GAB59350.1 conserved hypothetical protein [Rheinheimera nanhaiensis E407-8]